MTQTLKGLLAWASLLFLTLGAIWILTAPSLQSARETEETYVRKLALLARLQALPNEESSIRKQLEKLSNEAAEHMLYSGAANTVQLQIQRDVRQLALQDNLAVRSTRALPRYPQASLLQKASVQLNFTTTHSQLVSFLKRIESASPLLRVSHISIRVQRPSTNTVPADLIVSMDVAGFQKTPNEGPAR